MLEGLTSFKKLSMEESGVINVKLFLFLLVWLYTSVNSSSLLLLAFGLTEA